MLKGVCGGGGGSGGDYEFQKKSSRVMQTDRQTSVQKINM